MKQGRIQLEMDDGEQSQNSVLEPLMRIPSDAADMVHSYQLEQLERLQNGQYLDWATAGIVSGFWDGLETRAQTMLDNPTLYNIGNWLTLGLFDVIKGALFPEEPLSLQHWLDSAGLAATTYGGYKTSGMVRSYYGNKKYLGSNEINGGKVNVSIAQYGDDFGKMGVYVEKPDIKIDWNQYAEHGMERMNQRGLSHEFVESIIQNGKVLSQNSGSKFAYVTKEGVVILSKEGKLITTWGSAQFDDSMLEIISKLFEE